MTSLTVVQQVAATPERAYAAFLSAETLAGWWWPHIADTRYTLEAWVGGGYEIRSEAVGIGVRGEFLELDAPRRMRLSWNWMNDGVSQVREEVDIVFNAEGEATRIELTHFLSPLAGTGDDLHRGWTDVLGRLAGYLAP